MSRKKLLKLIGKELEYTATFDKVCAFGTNVVLEDVKYKGKLLTDHVWVKKSESMDKYKHGDVLRFKATAHTYTDKVGERKNGLGRCHHFMMVNDSYDDCSRNYDERNKRKG